MDIALAAGSITLTKADGSVEVISTNTVNTVTAHWRPVYLPVTYDNYQTSIPQVWDPSTATWSNPGVSSTEQWLVYIQLNNIRYEVLYMGQVGGDGADWDNTQEGANTAVEAIQAVLPTGGGGGGEVMSVNGMTGDVELGLGDLTDVELTDESDDQVLTFEP